MSVEVSRKPVEFFEVLIEEILEIFHSLVRIPPDLIERIRILINKFCDKNRDTAYNDGNNKRNYNNNSTSDHFFTCRFLFKVRKKFFRKF